MQRLVDDNDSARQCSAEPPDAPSALVAAARAHLLEVGDGDEEFAAELFGEYVAMLTTGAAQLRQFASRNDLLALQQEAHSLKGATLSVGLPTLAAHFKDLEVHSRAGDRAAIDESVAAIVELAGAIADLHRTAGVEGHPCDGGV